MEEIAAKRVPDKEQLDIKFNDSITLTSFDRVQRVARIHGDNVWRMDKDPSDRLRVRMTLEITGILRRADLDRFAQAMTKTAAFEFEDGGGGQ